MGIVIYIIVKRITMNGHEILFSGDFLSTESFDIRFGFITFNRENFFMKTILVPTDFSECAEHALNYACYIAEKTNSKIILLHVLPAEEIESNLASESEWMGGAWAGEHSDISAPAMMRLLKATKRKMSTLMSLSSCKKISIMDVIEIGRVNRMINVSVKKHNADMIVMGTHGTSGLNEIFIGSNTEHVVRDAEVPVLAVKEGHELPEIKNIVFATDFSTETDLIFPSVKNFADIFNANLHLVKIINTPVARKQKEMQFMIEEFMKGMNENKVSTHIYYHDVKDAGIRNFAETVHADLIALGTHGRHGLARFFKGSIAENLVNHAAVPVLTINFHKKQLEKISKIKGTKNNVEEEVAEGIISETFYSGHVPSI